jgi:hypothetical protein
MYIENELAEIVTTGDQNYEEIIEEYEEEILIQEKVPELPLTDALLGEKFRSDDTIHTIIRKISFKTKLRAKLHSFYDCTIHVRGDIYRALVFVFYIK